MRIILSLFTLFLLGVATTQAQTQSSVVYPIVDCVGGGCLPATSTITHITATYFDTINEVLFIGGKFDTISGYYRNGLAAINAVTGAVLPWNPIVNNGTVYSITKSGDSIFVGGTFTMINGITRNKLAAIHYSNSSLCSDFNSGFNTSTDTVHALLWLGNQLYVAGRFSLFSSTTCYNIIRFSNGGALDVGWIPAGSGCVRKLSFISGKIVTLSDYSSATANEICTITASGVTRIQRAYSDPGFLIKDFALRGNVAFMIGPFFSINGISRQTTAAVDLNTGVLTSWNPIPSESGWDTRNKYQIEYFRDSLYIGNCDINNNATTYHHIYVSHYSTGSLRILKTYNSNQTALNGYFNDNLIIGNARMIEIERYAQHTSFPYGCIDCHFYSYCLKPPALPGPFTLASNQACPGDTNKIYSVLPLAYFRTYTWQPMNVNIVPSGNSYITSVDILPAYSVASTLRVYGVTSCGISTSAFRSITISPLPLPNANAGNDDTLNCITSQLSLYGTSSTLGATFNWSGPSGNSNVDSILVNMPGNYLLTVHGPNGCWKYDTINVAIDTIRPNHLPFGTIDPLTCRDSISLLDASQIYLGDSIYWTGPGLVSNSNPATATQSANYLLEITNRNNGCSNTDTIFVPQNIVIPNASIVAPDTVLTCTITSVLLDGASLNPDVTFQWTDSSNTYFSNPFNDSLTGYFQLLALDTLNGCENVANLILITSWLTPPGINSLPDSIFLNCSYDSLQISATSMTSGTSFQWFGPNSFSSGDPATVSQQGNYYVMATHPQNGCTSLDSVYTGFAMTLELQSSNDTSICPGSGAVLQTFPIGGTSNFSYNWNNGAGNTSMVTVLPADSLEYIVTVIDAMGCFGSDTVLVNVPDPIGDSILSFQPCDPNQPTGQVQVYAYNGVPPFQFSIDNGISWNGNGVFTNLNYGSYSVLIQDALGCTQTDVGIIDTNSLSPAPYFLVCSSPDQGDTIVVVDISNPRPDSVVWDLPMNAIVTDSNMFAPAFINSDTGQFTLTMHAWYGTCEVVFTKNIHVTPFDSLHATLWNDNGIDTMLIYPNPNNGTFNFDVTLQSKQDFVILVYDAGSIERFRTTIYNEDHWNGQLSVPNPVSGNYFIRVIAEYDSDETTFVITQ